MSSFTGNDPLPFPPPLPAEAFVLAGGRSIRMGQDKALVSVGGQTLIALALDKLRALPLASPPRIAGSRSDLSFCAPVLDDLHPGCGPLSGMEAALKATAQPINLFLPIDLPLLPSEFLAWMLARASLTGALATFPRVMGRAQPLCAIYHRDLLEPITRSLLAGEYKVTRAIGGDAIDAFDMELITTTCPELNAFSRVPWRNWFRNLNTPVDVATVLI